MRSNPRCATSCGGATYLTGVAMRYALTTGAANVVGLADQADFFEGRNARLNRTLACRIATL